MVAEAVENGKGSVVQRRRPREGTGGQRPPLERRTQVKQTQLQFAHIDAGGERGSRGGRHALVVEDSEPSSHQRYCRGRESTCHQL